MDTVTVSPKYQVVIPLAVRERANIRVGERLQVICYDDRVELIPVRDLIHIAVGWIRQDPRALLCEQPGCSRCQAVRASVRVSL